MIPWLLYGAPILLVTVIAAFGLAYDCGILPRKKKQ